ncbi:SpoIIAA-like [Nitrosomonas cryotolerans]|uniref:SpoIIAA-like n=1 Tax=Nitrosomonas cryotolerans ATCC 49181 TaxID=1131553 RepID=A0A1N6J082_9PROT|nr:STAS/SEC14 domain-containing protein [Nitrosomonas cryotolerans]SFP54466.1 SpoIIAA-like [Nitrosomonas cryotolerans]SIO37536.1 SpoIIAA-like [Nitrosomonas cryotolerans ATCC 49181]
MITIQTMDNLVIVAVIGEFTLADYKEFEEQVLYKAHFDGQVNVLFDWRDMLDYTVDVAWEEIKFMREHGREFNRVAVVTDDQWQAWSAWVSNLFIEADVLVFSDYDEAKDWVSTDE